MNDDDVLNNFKRKQEALRNLSEQFQKPQDTKLDAKPRGDWRPALHSGTEIDRLNGELRAAAKQQQRQEAIDKAIAERKREKTMQEAMRRVARIDYQTKKAAVDYLHQCGVFEQQHKDLKSRLNPDFPNRSRDYQQLFFVGAVRGFFTVDADAGGNMKIIYNKEAIDQANRPGQKILEGNHKGLTPEAQAQAGKMIKRGRGR